MSHKVFTISCQTFSDKTSTKYNMKMEIQQLYPYNQYVRIHCTIVHIVYQRGVSITCNFIDKLKHLCTSI